MNSFEMNRNLIRRYYHELWNQWRFDLARDILAEDIRFRGSLAVEVHGIEGFKEYMRLVQRAFPDFTNSIQELISEGERIVARLAYEGTHRGELFGIPPTGKKVAYYGVAIFRIVGEKIAEGWVLGDAMGPFKQLDAHRVDGRAVAESTLVISPPTDEEREWAASLMARSEPWVALGRSIAQCRRVFHDPEYRIFVLHLDHKPCAFAVLDPRGLAGSPYLKSLAVTEEFRGRALGSRMLGFIESLFRSESPHMFLCVSSFNERARRFYERQGYAAVGEFQDYLIPGASEVLMHKLLR